jgi:hypothetical protein
MQPTRPDERKRLIDAAAKAFPSQQRPALEREFDELEALRAKRFTTESGCLPQREMTRLNELAGKFSPKAP